MEIMVTHISEEYYEVLLTINISLQSLVKQTLRDSV